MEGVGRYYGGSSSAITTVEALLGQDYLTVLVTHSQQKDGE